MALGEIARTNFLLACEMIHLDFSGPDVAPGPPLSPFGH